MGLADNLAAADQVRTGAPLRLDAILATLTDPDRTALEAALRDPAAYPPNRIVRALAAEGVTCDPNSVGTWRRHNGVT